MSDDREAQLDAFKEAVDRKAADAEEASHHPGQGPGGTPLQNPEAEDRSPSQDVGDPRTGGSRHGQVTADKWNQ